MNAAQKYLVTAVSGKREWTPKGETQVKKIYYDLTVEGAGRCSLGLNPTDPEPHPGQEIFAVLKAGENGKDPTLIIPGSKGGGGGGRGWSPEQLAHEQAKQRSIAMQASQKVAVDVCAPYDIGSAKERTAAVKAVAKALYEQVQEVSAS